MSDMALYRKGVYPYSAGWWEERDDDTDEFALPLYSYQRRQETMILEEVKRQPSDTVMRLMLAKRVRKTADDLSASATKQDKRLIRIAYVIFVGLAFAIIGVSLRFVIAGPMPFALAAFGMAFITIALWYGGKVIGKAHTRLRVG